MKTGYRSIQDALMSKLRVAGFDCRVVMLSRLDDLEAAVMDLKRRAELDPVFFDERLSFFEFEPRKTFKDARSIIVISIPQPMTRVVFRYQGQPLSAVIPPTYIRTADGKAASIMNEVLVPRGYASERCRLPLKTLAVQSGLAEYGRNNVTYCPATGSFHRLVAYYSQLPCDQDEWREPVMMEACGKCRACERKCPTRAIADDRFLIRAEKCLSYFNERTGDFPDDLDPAVHHCIVGCMICQVACPVNKDVSSWVEAGASFDEEETLQILTGRSKDDLSAETLDKLESLCLAEVLEILPRNLMACLGQSRKHNTEGME